MLAGAWDEAEETLAEAAEETQEAAEERRTRVASAEITERTLVERHEGRTAREWADVADRHAERSTEAYETAREI
ncbi:hypothetical protein, partial [Streptomyces sp. GSL17-113]|uniref:hypothetical protein n=1 Tax=Streptomyces sp. GSL17-113 TaxID=3115365 RepID=UPI002E75D72B